MEGCCCWVFNVPQSIAFFCICDLEAEVVRYIQVKRANTFFLQLPPEDVKEFLEHVAAPRANRGWEFLLPTDVDFIKKHPDVAHRQNMLWLGIQSK